MNFSPPASIDAADPYAPDGRYAYRRLALSLAFATILGAGMWAVAGVGLDWDEAAIGVSMD